MNPLTQAFIAGIWAQTGTSIIIDHFTGDTNISPLSLTIAALMALFSWHWFYKLLAKWRVRRE